MHGDVEQCVLVESVELDASGATREILVLVRDLRRPGCRFGWRAPAVEPVPDPMEARPWTTVVWTNFEEDLTAIGYGLPEECVPGVVTWF